jgi:hypothetical protein
LALRPLALGTDLIHAAFLAALIVFAVVVTAAAAIAVRRTLIERGGSVECGLRNEPARRWRLGLAEYRPDELRWYPVFGVLLRPSAVFTRHGLNVVTRRPAELQEVPGLGPGTMVVECDTGAGDGQVELALSQDALTGFLAWLEAAPPGQNARYG